MPGEALTCCWHGSPIPHGSGACGATPNFTSWAKIRSHGRSKGGADAHRPVGCLGCRRECASWPVGGDEWQEYCEQLFALKHPGSYARMPDEDRGDLGIEGYSTDGTVPRSPVWR